MNIQRPFSIRGVGKYLPKYTISSSQIESDLGLPNQWIDKHVGVQNRHIAKEETNTDMGKQALVSALLDANLSISDLDCLIGASATFDHVIPNRSSLIKHAFVEARGLDFPCIDINTVCTSFVTALDYASMLLATREYHNIAIVSSEISSKGLNPNNAETFSLFGDGAAAIIISKSEVDAGLVHYKSRTYSEEAKATIIEGGGNKYHTKDFPYCPELYSFKMEGKTLLRNASITLPRFLEDFFFKDSISLSATDLIVPHQASRLGLKMLAKINGGNTANIVDQLAQYGNCIAASIPIALVNSIKSKRLNEGDSCFLIGTAAGITISGLLFKYTRL